MSKRELTKIDQNFYQFSAKFFSKLIHLHCAGNLTFEANGDAVPDVIAVNECPNCLARIRSKYAVNTNCKRRVFPVPHRQAGKSAILDHFLENYEFWQQQLLFIMIQN